MPRDRNPHPLDDPRLGSVAQALRRRAAVADPEPGEHPEPLLRAAVALVVRPDLTDLELLLIRRAEFAGDPWSGHMALPGGRRDPADRDALATAVRETREEVGVDLGGHGAFLGPLDPVLPRAGAPPVEISPFVFAVPPGTQTVINHEVDVAVWIPMGHLERPGAATEYMYALSTGERLRFPAYGFQDYVIWGLTYRILSQFLEIAGAARQERHGE